MLGALQMALDVPGLRGKDRISAEIDYLEHQLRIAEAELHELYVQQIREESSSAQDSTAGQ